MLKAGTKTFEDNGFTIERRGVGFNTRQALVIELPAGITQTQIEAFCAGPIEVLDDGGNTVATYTGPFVAAGHTLTLMRESAEADVSALTARITALEAELAETRATSESAVNELANAREALSALKLSVAETGE
ncbi:MAG: hypothetical protein EOM52_06765 [Clostridia bacterium]|nr:hypothetical protein [Clostridia bacterium]